MGCIFGNNGNIWVTERLVDMEGNSINSTVVRRDGQEEENAGAEGDWP